MRREAGRRWETEDGRRTWTGLHNQNMNPTQKMWGKMHEQITINKKQSTQIMKTITNCPKPNLYSTPKKKIA